MRTDPQIEAIVRLALAEDLGPGDLSSRLCVPEWIQGAARYVARQPLVLSGLSALRETLRQVDPALSFSAEAAEGQSLAASQNIGLIEGSARSILAAERLSLNFLMRLSGVATLTAAYVRAIAGTSARLVDTRKTSPGLRLLEKMAVRHGGGHNHRFALYDGILIKDNHLAAVGSIAAAVGVAQKEAPHGLKIEVEVDSLHQLNEALAAGADIILLDNMPPEILRQAVAITRAHDAKSGGRTLLEASGGVNLQSVRAIAESGVDFISVGALTHSAPAVDIGLDYQHL